MRLHFAPLSLVLALGLASAAIATEIQVPTASTTESPDLVDYNGYLYVFYNKPGSSIQYQTHLGGASWSAATPVPGTQSVGKSPATANFGGRLYVCYRHEGTNSTLYLVSMDSGGNWSSEISIPGPFVKGDPSLAVFNSKLYVVYTENITEKIRFSASTDGATFGPSVVVPSANSASGPAGARFSGLLYIFWRNYGNANRYSIVNAAGVITGPFAAGGLTSLEQHATPDGGGGVLHLFYKGQSSNNLYIRSVSQSGVWSSEQDTGADSSRGPGGLSRLTAPFIYTLYLTYKGSGNSNVYVNDL